MPSDLPARARFESHALLTAVQFLTRVPAPGGMNRPGADPRLLPASVRYFPVVGGLIGLFTGLVAWAAGQYWPPGVAALLALAAEALLTGAFHEDAVADSCDALGGGWTRDDVLRIMKDSRVGSFGALGLGLAVALRWATLAAVPPGEVVLVAAFAGALGRLCIVALMRAVPPVPDWASLTRDVGERASLTTLTAAIGLTLPVLVVALVADPVRALAGVALAGAVTAGWGWYVRRRLGGVTGDCLGAAAVFGQVAVMLAWMARL